MIGDRSAQLIRNLPGRGRTADRGRCTLLS
jgi:hypothetical protein